MSPKKTLVLSLSILALLIILSCLFTIQQGSQGLVSRLGKLKHDSSDQAIVYDPGLHAKIPFIERVLKFDVRLQTLDIQASRIVTQEKKDVIVDYFVKWRIADLARYYKSTGGQVFRAEKLLEQQVNDGLRAEFGQRTIQDVVSEDRSSIMVNLKEKAAKNGKKLGVYVVDVRIKRIDLPEEVSSKVFERMRSERERVAKEHRAEGRMKAEAMRAEADANAEIIVANAKKSANETKAEGDRLAAKIYADAYNKDPKFYAFYRSLDAYQSVFDSEKNILVLTPESQFFEYFNSSKVGS